MTDEATVDPRDDKIALMIQGQPRVFANFDELDAWFRAEHAAFSDYAGSIANATRDMPPRMQAIQAELSVWRDRKQQLREKSVERLGTRLNQFFSVVALSESEEGQFLKALAAESKRASGVAYCVLHNISPPHLHEHADYIRGAVQAALFGTANKPTREAIIESINADRREFTTWWSSVRSELEAATEQAASSLETARKEHEHTTRTYQNDMDGLLTKHGEAGDTQRQKYAADMDALKATYDKQMALQWPASYWKRKARRHKRKAKRFSVAFGVSMGVSAVFIAFLGLALISPIEDLVALKVRGWWDVPVRAEAGEATSPIIKATAFAALLAIIYWILRLLARNMISHQHLEADASERRIMIMTYLALLRRGKAMSDEEIKLVLAPIFRPSADGMIREDPGPSSAWLELLRGGK